MKRLLGRKNELLRVLDRPDIPLNTNASENDIRAFVTKRKISGGTVSEKGRQTRDAMLGLAKTCKKLKIPILRLSRRTPRHSRPRNPKPRNTRKPRPRLNPIARKSAPVTKRDTFATHCLLARIMRRGWAGVA